jgi:Domain of unknown function (DUF5076)
MAFISDHQIYDALPISNDALDKGGVELLRAGVVDEELFVTARRVAFPEPAHWGWMLADITRRLASLYAADGTFSEAEVRAAIVSAFARSFRSSGARAVRPSSPHAAEGKGAKPGKSGRPRAKARVKLRAKSQAKSKSSTKVVARRKRARPKP